MKFPQTTELYKFLQEKNIFPELQELREICKGGSSYNFLVRTAAVDYLLKLVPLKREEEYNRLISVLIQFNFVYVIKENVFSSYRMLALPYIHGHGLRYKDCTPKFVSNLCEEHDKLQKINLDTTYILPQQNSKQLSEELESLFFGNNKPMIRLIHKYFWLRFKAQLVNFGKTKEIIHGDFTANNIFVDEQQNAHILDVASLRYGYAGEDFAYLFLQLSGFRGLFGSIKRFLNLQREREAFGQKRIKPEQWFYGVQMFYLNNLRRHLRNKKKQTLRKEFCLFVSLMSYFRLKKAVLKGVSDD